jgi:CelD/BcsL family acetyltransferase involved in cellulose biosynthesis
VRQLRPVGEDLFDYNDPIVRGPRLSADEAATLLETFWIALFGKVLDGSRDGFDDLKIARVRSQFVGKGQVWKAAELAPFVDLTKYSSYETYWGSRSSSLRQDVGRNIRRLSSLGKLEYRDYPRDRWEDALNWIPRLEAARSSRYPDSALPTGYLERLARAGASAPTHLSALLLDGRDISWHVGFYIDGIFYWYIPMFEAALGNYSPGKVHLHFAIQALCRNGGIGFDFLRGVEAYKSAWTNGVTSQMYGIHIKAGGLSSWGRRTFSRALNNFGYLRAATTGKPRDSQLGH